MASKKVIIDVCLVNSILKDSIIEFLRKINNDVDNSTETSKVIKNALKDFKTVEAKDLFSLELLKNKRAPPKEKVLKPKVEKPEALKLKVEKPKVLKLKVEKPKVEKKIILTKPKKNDAVIKILEKINTNTNSFKAKSSSLLEKNTCLVVPKDFPGVKYIVNQKTFLVTKKIIHDLEYNLCPLDFEWCIENGFYF